MDADSLLGIQVVRGGRHGSFSAPNGFSKPTMGKPLKVKDHTLILGSGELRRVNGKTVKAAAYEMHGEMGADGLVRVWKKRSGDDDNGDDSVLEGEGVGEEGEDEEEEEEE